MYPGFPARWIPGPSREFEAGRDLAVRRSGSASAYVRSINTQVSSGEIGTIIQQMRADAYRGKRVRFSGWIRTSDVGGGVGLWLRGDGATLGPFDNMSDRWLTGTSDWKYVSIVLDVPQGVIGFAFGVLLVGPGIAWIDDLSFEIVDESVPVTRPLGERAYTDTLALTAQYNRHPLRPTHLGFESEQTAAQQPATVTWLRNASFPFTTDDPDVPSSDLDPLRPLVGDAKIVALGEATHGTREFFRMKHRVLTWLVREMGFSHFGIEASLPEALAVDHYVQTGVGDPAKLLSDLRFWTWNTTEVFAMIEWMRAWNAAGNQPRVHFTGFDMQFAGVAIDSVTAFTSRMDATVGATVTAAYQCLNDLREPRNNPNPDMKAYNSSGPDYQASCRLGIRNVDSLFAHNEAAWTSAAGAEKVRVMRRLARVIDQWEELAAASNDAGYIIRDRYMAENVAWWHETHAPGAKMVLWAHNGHISRVPGAMGDNLSRRFGAEYLIVGQTFGSGSFNAVMVSNTYQILNLTAHQISGLREEAIERVFQATGADRLIFDARRLRTDNTPAAEPLHLPVSIRAIGATYRPADGPNSHQAALFLLNDYDLIIWFRTATASQLLPYLPSLLLRSQIAQLSSPLISE
jgi:erythromycin esterase